MLVVVDYGMGNLRSVAKALEAAGGRPTVSSDPGVVAQATQLVVPGVGAGPHAMQELTARGLIQPIVDHIRQSKPYLGICLGLQLLFERTDEGTGSPTLGVLPGTVKRFAVTKLKVPQIGWNRVTRTPAGRTCPLFAGLEDGEFFYFVHSYYAAPAQAQVASATTDYGGDFTSAVWYNRVFATQFHPEKSQRAGIRLLQNFLTQCR